MCGTLEKVKLLIQICEAYILHGIHKDRRKNYISTDMERDSEGVDSIHLAV